MTNDALFRDIQSVRGSERPEFEHDVRVNSADLPGTWPPPSQREMLRVSFARLIPESDLAVEEFYRDLFAQHPAVRPLFPQDLSALHDKFMMMLAWFLDHLDRPEAAVKECARLGERHREYGALPAHYGPVGQILIQVLSERAHLNEEETVAWKNLYETMSQLMTAGAAPRS